MAADPKAQPSHIYLRIPLRQNALDQHEAPMLRISEVPLPASLQD